MLVNYIFLLALAARCAGAFAPMGQAKLYAAAPLITPTRPPILEHNCAEHKSSSVLAALPPPASLAVGFDSRVAGAALGATARLLSTVGLGAAAAKTPNLLDKQAISSLSKLIYRVFQPSFLFCSVLKTVATGGKQGMPMTALLLMPLAAAIQIGSGSMFSLLASKIAGLKGDEERDARICMTFANSGPLPFIFADALFSGSKLTTELTSCISFYLLFWTPTYWSYGRSLLGTYGDSSDTDQNFASKAANQVKKFFSPPVAGAALGLFAGSVPFLRDAFMGRNSILSPMFGAMQTLGSAYLPAALLVLAGSLVGSGKGDNVDVSAQEEDEKTEDTKMRLRTIVSIMFARFVLGPLGALGTVHLLGAIGLLPEIGSRARAVVSFAILLEGCMPPAQNTVVMLQLDNKQARAERMAKALTIFYSLAIVPVTLLVTVALNRTNIMALR